jgi:hypothetical protein
MQDSIIIMLAFDDHDSFYELDQQHCLELSKLPLCDMLSFVVDNGRPVACYSDNEADVYIPEEIRFVDSEGESEIRQTLADFG